MRECRRVGTCLGPALFALALTLPSGPASGDTPIDAGIVKDTTWDINGSPYLLKGQIPIAKGVTVTIKAGVKIRAQAGTALIVYGDLDVRGTKSDPVRFTSDGSLSRSHWAGIDIQTPYADYDTYSILKGCIIEYAGAGMGATGALRVSGLRYKRGHVRLENTVIRKTVGNGLYSSRNGVGTVTMQNCTVEDCGQRPIQLANCGGPHFLGTNNFRDNNQNWIGASGLFHMVGVWERAPVPYSWPSGGAPFVNDGALTILRATVVAPESAGSESIIVDYGGSLSAYNATFTSWREFTGHPPIPGGWSGLWARGGAVKCLLNSCRVRGAGRGGAAVRSDGATTLLYVRACEIAYSNGGVWINQCAKKTALLNTVFHDLTGTGLFITGSGAQPLVARCCFEDISGDAIRITGGAGAYLGNLDNLNPNDDGGNAFLDRRQYAVRNESSQRIKAENNWWGFTTSKQIDAAAVYDRRDSSTSGFVDFAPFLKEEPAVGHGGVARPMGLTVVPTGAGGAAISFSLAAPAAVDVTVLNLAGRLVRRVCADRPLAEGMQTVPWDGRADNGVRTPNGAYLVSVTARTEAGAEARALGALHLSR